MLGPRSRGCLGLICPRLGREPPLQPAGERGRQSWAPFPASAQFSIIFGRETQSDLRFQRCFLGSARIVPGLVAWLPSHPGQPFGAGRQRRGPACSLERPDGNTL